MTKEDEYQDITCLNCGAKWRYEKPRGNMKIVAYLVLCPLCWKDEEEVYA